MPRKKTRKTVSESSAPPVDLDDELDDELYDESVEEVVSKPVVVEKKQTHFTAILRNAKTYNLAGRTFIEGEPVEVPIQHLKMFKNNGWFLVQIIR